MMSYNITPNQPLEKCSKMCDLLSLSYGILKGSAKCCWNPAPVFGAYYSTARLVKKISARIIKATQANASHDAQRTPKNIHAKNIRPKKIFATTRTHALRYAMLITHIAQHPTNPQPIFYFNSFCTILPKIFYLSI